jgi:hypothetical protein
MIKHISKIKKKNKGVLLIQILVFSGVAITIIGALASWAATTIKAGRITFNREEALQSAEAGIDYYRWHLAHEATDYQDGTGISGPYVHFVKDENGNTVGNFSLDITAPPIGSTVVKIKSTGSSVSDSSYTREIISTLAKPSIAKYAFAGNSAMRFGTGTEIYGPVFSNGGIRFDGLAHNIVSSATTTYTDTDADACTGANSYGVHTCLPAKDPTSPTALPTRSDVFEAGRLISQPAISFSGFTTDLAILKTAAQSTNGFYRDTNSSSYVGYHVVLKTNDTFDLYKIKSWVSLGNCSTSGTTVSWSINKETLLGNYAFPTNGVMFFQDNVVIDGQINGARLTIIAALLPVPSSSDDYKSIIINNNLLYTNFDGTDTIGLIGQNNVKVGMISNDNLTIDGATIAQNGNVGRFYYSGSSCPYRNRSTISLYGMIASYNRYGFAFTDNTGYTNRNISYDANLLYAPPPNFPLTSDQYQILSWQQIR